MYRPVKCQSCAKLETSGTKDGWKMFSHSRGFLISAVDGRPGDVLMVGCRTPDLPDELPDEAAEDEAVEMVEAVWGRYEGAYLEDELGSGPVEGLR